MYVTLQGAKSHKISVNVLFLFYSKWESPTKDLVLRIKSAKEGAFLRSNIYQNTFLANMAKLGPLPDPPIHNKNLLAPTLIIPVQYANAHFILSLHITRPNVKNPSLQWPQKAKYLHGSIIAKCCTMDRLAISLFLKQ